MSYEGYVEFLCSHGHLWTVDADNESDSKESCPSCGEPQVWRHAVDQTNGEIDGDPSTQPWPLKIIGYYEKRIQVPRYEVPKSPDDSSDRNEPTKGG